ncbi:MAG: DNA polymerase III subunit beta [Burkholderiaceae bacterium]
MVIVKATREAILKPLQTVAGIVERRHTLPILANVLLRKKGSQVSMVATDVEIQIETSAQIGAGSDDVEITISARKLLDILRALPDLGDKEVSLSLSNRKATLSAGKSRFSLQTLAADDFPSVTPSETWAASLKLPQKTLRHIFHMVHFAMAQQDIRYYLNGLLFITEGDTVRVVATDGHRLALCETTIEGANLSRQDVIIPRKTVLELQRLLGDNDDEVAIDIANNQIRFEFGQVTMLSKLVEGKFPDYQRVVPTGYTNQLEIGRASLAGSLTRASILTSEKFKGIRMSLSDEGVKLQITNSDQEEAHEELEANYYGETIEIGFNVTYLQDVLSNLKTDKVLIGFGDSNSSALLTVADEPGFSYVVMPMRI